MFKLIREMQNDEENQINAGDEVVSRSPGSKGWTGKVATIKGDSVLVQFENGKKFAVPLNHLTKV